MSPSPAAEVVAVPEIAATLVRARAAWGSLLAGLLLLVAAICLAPLYWENLNTPVASVSHDDAVYMLTAKAIAEGHGLRILSSPQPAFQTKYPILFPALLAVLWRIDSGYPHNLTLLRLLPSFFALCWFAAAWWLIRQETGRAWAASLAIVVLAASPWILYLSTTVMSDSLFALLVTLSIIALRRTEQEPNLRWTMAAALLAGLAYQTRAIGITLLGAGFLTLLGKRQYRQALLFSGISGAAVLPWIAWQWLNSRNADPYLSHVNYYRVANLVAAYPWSEKVRIFIINICTQFLTPLTMTGMRPDYTFAESALCLVFAILFFAGLRRYRQGLALRLCVALTLGLLLLWVFPVQRYMLVLLPFVAVLLWYGSPVRCRGTVFAALFLGMLALEVPELLAYHGTVQRQGAAYPWHPLDVDQPDGWQNTQRQFAWVRQNVPSDAVVFAFDDPLVYLETGRHSVRGLAADQALVYYTKEPNIRPFGTPDALLTHFARTGVSYVLCSPFPAIEEAHHISRLIHETAALHPGTLVRIATIAPGFDIFRVERERLPN